jgi:putative phosphoribosyl transferase
MFVDRSDAGRQLAERLGRLATKSPVVLGLPRGGVAVAAEIARALDAPLDVLVVRKLGAPMQQELAIGAVIDGDPPQRVLNEDLIRLLGVDEQYLDAVYARQLAEARRRQDAYRRGRAAIAIAGRTVIVVDDGVATGATMRAALAGLKRVGVKRLVLAVPVGAPEAIDALRRDVDEMVCLATPAMFAAVGAFYRDFGQTTDDEVIALLDDAAAR